jgi:hypothetical protein
MFYYNTYCDLLVFYFNIYRDLLAAARRIST